MRLLLIFLLLSVSTVQFSSSSVATANLAADELRAHGAPSADDTAGSSSAEPDAGKTEDAPAKARTPSAASQPANNQNMFPSEEELCDLLMSAAEENSLPAGFFINLIWQESRFIRTAVSSAGALGVAQFMPAVARQLGVGNPFNPREAVPASARLLNELHRQFGNLGLAAAAYNAGPKRVSDWVAKRSRLPRETRDYVRIITGRPAEHWTITPGLPIDMPISARVPCSVQHASMNGRSALRGDVSSAPTTRIKKASLSEPSATDRQDTVAMLNAEDAAARSGALLEDQLQSPRSTGGAAWRGPPSMFRPEERTLIRQAIMRASVALRNPECRHKERTAYAIGRPFPRTTRVCALPEEIKSKVRTGGRYRYLVVLNDIVLIDPDKRHRIVEVIQ